MSVKLDRTSTGSLFQSKVAQLQSSLAQLRSFIFCLLESLCLHGGARELFEDDYDDM